MLSPYHKELVYQIAGQVWPEVSPALIHAQVLVESGGDHLAGLSGLHDNLAKSHPALERGKVKCRHCGKEQRVDSAKCMQSGWPECCGETMMLITGAEKPS